MISPISNSLAMDESVDRRAEDLVIAVLAELSTRNVDTIRMNNKNFHESFGRVLERLKAGGGELQKLAEGFYKNVVSESYEEVDHALITAEQFGFVKFPNPSYSRLTIAITPRMAYRLLRSWNDQEREMIRVATSEMLDRQIA